MAQLAADDDTRRITSYRGRSVLTVLDDHPTSWRLCSRTADRVADALDAAGVTYFATHLPGTKKSRLAVFRRDLGTVAESLVASLGAAGFYLESGAQDARPVPVLDGLAPEQLETVQRLTLFQYVQCTVTGRKFGPAHGCDLVVWDSDDRDCMVSPTRQSAVQAVDPGELRLVDRPRWDGRPEPRLAGTEDDAFAIDFPVDAVYLWVDDSDPLWRERREAVRAALGLQSAAGADESAATHRYRDRGELKASLRSLEMFAPWVRNIYLVTDDQQPDWLDVDHGRVTVVDHRDIFEDPSNLPTYNSHAIGAQVHRIPGLSEHYLLMNDDVMFSRSVTPYDFFTPLGQLKVTFSTARHPDIPQDRQTSLERARSNSADLLRQEFGRRASRVFAHVPVPQRKDIAYEIERRYADDVSRTVASRFRAPTDVVICSWLHLYTAMFTGRGVRSDIRFGYFNTASESARARMAKPDFAREYEVICLNDAPAGKDQADAETEWLERWLLRRYPFRAPFER